MAKGSTEDMWSAGTAHQEYRLTRIGLLAGLVFAMLLVVVTIVRYPGDADSTSRYLRLGLFAVLALVSISGWIALRGPNIARAHTALAVRYGTRAGLLFGLLWLLELGFNNLLPPEVSTASTRLWVDNGIWATIAGLTIVVAATCALRTRRIMAGVQAGFWSGLISGLIACLIGLLLVTAWMNLLLRDPLAIQEFAERGAATGAPNMPTYVAYGTMTGALLHLFVLGIGFGTILGVLGGLVGKGIALVRGKPSPLGP